MSNISSINLTFIDAVTVYSISKANAESNHGSLNFVDVENILGI